MSQQNADVNKNLQESGIKSIVQSWKRCYWWNKTEAGQNNAPRWTCYFIDANW